MLFLAFTKSYLCFSMPSSSILNLGVYLNNIPSLLLLHINKLFLEINFLAVFVLKSKLIKFLPSFSFSLEFNNILFILRMGF